MQIINTITNYVVLLYSNFLYEIDKISIGRRIVKGTFWSLISAIISKGSHVIIMIIVARILGIKSFGEYGIIITTVNMFQIISLFGGNVTAAKFVAEHRESNKIETGRVIAIVSILALITGLFACFIFFLTSPWIATNLLNNSEISYPLKISSFILLFTSWIGVQNGALAGLEVFKKIAVVDLITKITILPATILFTYFFGLIGAISSLLITYFLHALLSSFALLKEINERKIKITISKLTRNIKLILNFSLPTMLTGFLWAQAIWINNAILINKSNYTQMGLFNAAYQWFLIGIFLPNIISRPFLPIMSERIQKKDYDLIKHILLKLIKIIVILLSIFCVIFSVFSKTIMSFYGSDFTGGYLILILILIASIFAAPQAIIGNYLRANDKIWYHFLINLGLCITYIAAGYILILLGYQALGLSLALLVSYVLQFIASIIILNILFRKNTSSQ